MKPKIGPVSFQVAALHALLVVGCQPPAEVSPVASRFNPEEVHGQVRVVLLRAGPVVMPQGASTFVVTYGVEVPREGAFSDLSFSSEDEIALMVHGKPLEYSGGVSSGSMGFHELPRPSELIQPEVPLGRAMIFQDTLFHGMAVDTRELDVRLQFSWRGNHQQFDFHRVPVGYVSARPAP